MSKPKLSSTRPALGAQPGGPKFPVGRTYTQLAAGGQLRTVPIDQVHPDPKQARQSFDPDALKALAESISELGVLQPPLVTTPQAGRYQLIAGERRWRAAKIAGLTQLQVIVRGPTDIALAALAENLQREDLDPIEEATAYARIIADHVITIAELARRLGIGRPAISNALRLLELSDPIQNHLRDRTLTKRHGIALLTEPDHGRREHLAKQAAAQGLSVTQLTTALKSQPHQQATPAAGAFSDFTEAAERLGQRMQIRQVKHGYRLTTTFTTADDLQAFLDRLADL